MSVRAKAPIGDIKGPYSSKDLQERAWYDAYRSRVLESGLQRQTGGQQVATACPFSDLMLQEHQSPSAFFTFDDTPKGFYAVFSSLFSRIHSQEEAAAEASAEKVQVSTAPPFGASDAIESTVKEFYAYWSSFQTVKDFVWLELHDPQSGTGRHMRRLLEAENAKARKAGKVAFVKQVRNLVDWVRSEDRRVQRARVCCQPLHMGTQSMSTKRYSTVANSVPSLCSQHWYPLDQTPVCKENTVRAYRFRCQ